MKKAPQLKGKGKIKKRLGLAEGRVLYRICKTLNITPEKIKDLSETQIDWLIENIHQDDIDEDERTKGIFEAIKPWLNLELYKALNKQAKTEVSETFQEELLKRQSTAEELSKIESKLESEINAT